MRATMDMVRKNIAMAGKTMALGFMQLLGPWRATSA